MKKSLFLLIFLLSQVSFAQQIRFNTYSGYIFKNTVSSFSSPFSFYEGTIQDGFRWGLGVEYLLDNQTGLELQYLRQNTNAPTRFTDPSLNGGEIRFTDFELGVNWIMLNGTRYFPVNEMLEPFAGLGFGMGIFSLTNPDTRNNNTITKLGWNVKGGTNLWLAENVAFKVQASLFSAIQGFGGGIYFGTGGLGGGLNTYSTMYQFGFEGGLVFRLSAQ